jgi:hypothetical protein
LRGGLRHSQREGVLGILYIRQSQNWGHTTTYPFCLKDLISGHKDQMVCYQEVGEGGRSLALFSFPSQVPNAWIVQCRSGFESQPAEEAAVNFHTTESHL